MINAKDFTELLLQFGWPAVAGLLFYRMVNFIFDWLSRGGSADKLKSVLPGRRRRLEKMLTQTYLSRETRNLARAELNMISRGKLIGYDDPRLQALLVSMCSRYNLPARYFTRWRAYLSEENGMVRFAHKRYRLACWFFMMVNLPLSTVYLIFMCFLFTKSFGLATLALSISLNAVWYFPWLYFTSPAAPVLTEKMKAYVGEFNARRT